MLSTIKIRIFEMTAKWFSLFPSQDWLRQCG